MDSQKSDLLLNESDILGGGKNEKKTITTKTRPRDILLNALSAMLTLVVVVMCNLLISPEFHYEQIYSWNFGLLVVVNWVCGIMMTYFLRQSGINAAKMTDNYKTSEKEKEEAFDRVKDYHEAQKRLNEKISADFDMRRNELENAIAKLVRPAMTKDVDGNAVEWKIGMPLPKKTHARVKIMKKRLEAMTPPEISLVALAQSEATFTKRSLYEIKGSPERTGFKWFLSKGTGKVGWFGVAPFVLSIVANGLIGGITIANVVSTIGIVAVMLFNAAREYSLSYYGVAKYGVERNRQIVRIINSIVEAPEPKPKAETK